SQSVFRRSRIRTMRTGHLTNRQVDILRSLRDKVSDDNRRLLDQVVSGTLPIDDIDIVRDLINEEYLMKGIREDYTSNAYGRELEQLVDFVYRPRFKRFIGDA